MKMAVILPDDTQMHIIFEFDKHVSYLLHSLSIILSSYRMVGFFGWLYIKYIYVQHVSFNHF